MSRRGGGGGGGGGAGGSDVGGAGRGPGGGAGLVFSESGRCSCLYYYGERSEPEKNMRKNTWNIGGGILRGRCGEGEWSCRSVIK
jgi:hypothetical protein